MFWLKLLAKIAGICLGLAAVGAGALVISAGVLHNKTIALPAPTGPYPIGRTVYDWVDEARPEIFNKNLASKRELMALVWYPATQQPGLKLADYLPLSWAEAREADWGIAAWLMQRPQAMRTHALADATVATSQPRYPVLIFMPGLGPLAADYTAVIEDLASHGYVIVALTPTYSASVVVFADGRVVKAVPEAGIPDDVATVSEEKRWGDHLMQTWAADALFGLNQAEKLNSDPKSEFFNRLDLTRVGFLGHSFGGATAAQACRLDPRCKAGVNWDGYPYGDVVEVGLKQPFMFIWSETTDQQDQFYQQAARDIQAIYGKLPNGGYQLTIRGARHFNFTDLAVLYAPVIRLMGLTGKIDGERGWRITSAYTVAFFDQYLKGVASPLLKGPSTVYPEVEFKAR
ncbi:MAG: hypothetical protein U0350_43810 [Caldilineaceae bacterium]